MLHQICRQAQKDSHGCFHFTSLLENKYIVKKSIFLF